MIRGRRLHRSSDGGETLVEILLAVVILGIAGTGLIGGLTMGVLGSDSHRRLTNVEVVARQYGEALLSQAMHPASTTLAQAASAGSNTVVVAGTTGFPAPPSFSAAIDGEAVTVTKVVGAVWTLSAALNEDHPAGSTAGVYLPCPTPAQLAVGSFAAGGNTVAVTKVEYFDSTGNLVDTVTAGASATCLNYWSTVTPCAQTNEHLTECDPTLVRATVSVTDQRGNSTSTSVLYRRANQ